MAGSEGALGGRSGELLMIRHGQASAGSEDYDRLSPLGFTQARLLGSWMRECGRVPDVVVSGGPRRQVETAKTTVAAMGIAREVEIDRGFDEFDHREVLLRHRPELADLELLRRELATADGSTALMAGAIGRWVSGEHADYGESWEAFGARVRAALGRVAERRARSVWVFTSAGPVGATMGEALGMPGARVAALAVTVMNGAVTRFEWREGGWGLCSFNAVGHLERDRSLLTML